MGGIIFIVIQLFFAVLIFYMCLAFITGAPFVPTPDRIAAEMVRLSGVTKGDRVYDLGSGDGRLVFLAARAGAIATGLEINPILVLYSRLRKLFMRESKNACFRWQNFWQADIRDADTVFLYLIPWHMHKLSLKLRREMKPGTVIVSNSFIFPDLKLIKSDEHNHIYVFRI